MKLPSLKMSAKDLSLDGAALDLLRAAEKGVPVFTPEDMTPETLAGFQQVVKMLRMLESRRYIAVISSLNLLAAGVGKSQVDKVRLSGGLTEKGRAVLAYHDERLQGYLNRQSA